MKRILAVVVAAVALLIPGQAALASEAPDPIGVSACPSGYTGVIVYHSDPQSGTTYVWACVPN